LSSFFKGLWSRTKKDPEARVLEHHRDLQKGDMVQLANHFGLPDVLRNKVFKITGVCTYQFEHENDTSFTLESLGDQKLSLSIETDVGRETAVFSYSISRSTVEELFDLDEFSEVFDSADAATLNTLNDANFDGWAANKYFQEVKGEKGYFYERDYRPSGPPVHEGEGELFEYYLLVNGDNSHGVEIEVYAGGETEVSLTRYLGMEMISGLWPAKQAAGK
jgi:hypothetical protein